MSSRLVIMRPSFSPDETFLPFLSQKLRVKTRARGRLRAHGREPLLEAARLGGVAAAAFDSGEVFQGLRVIRGDGERLTEPARGRGEIAPLESDRREAGQRIQALGIEAQGGGKGSVGF